MQEPTDNHFMDYCGISFESCERDHCVLKTTLQPQCKNPHGVAHGGLLFTMVDSTAGYAARTDGRDYVTQSAHVNFLSNVKEGTIYSEGTVIRRGHTITIVHVQVKGADGAVLLDGVMDMFCIDK